MQPDIPVLLIAFTDGKTNQNVTGGKSVSFKW
jgi:hypothetical protein